MSSTYDYSDDVASALDVIQQFGGLCQLVRNSSPGGSFPIHLVVDEFTAEDRPTSSTQYKDRKLLAAGAEMPLGGTAFIIDPETDTLFFPTAFGDIEAGVTLEIVTAVPIAPGGVNILWTIVGRR